jgi:hypothetical protein
MTRLLCLVVAGGLLGPGALPARAAEGCDEVAELRQAALRPPVDEITRGKIEALLNEAQDLCEAGEYADAETKFVNVRELLASDSAAPDDGASN